MKAAYLYFFSRTRLSVYFIKRNEIGIQDKELRRA
jgi:hypothetical protein